MKKKIYLICYAVVQIIISIYAMINVNSIAKDQVALIQSMFTDMPEGMQAIMAESFNLEVMTSSIMMTAIVCLVLGLILLWLFIRDRVPVRKGLAIGLTIVSLVMGLSDLVMLMAVVALILIARTDKETAGRRENEEIKKLRTLKITGKDLIWVVVLVLAYSTQFFVPKLINNFTFAFIFDILYNVLVFSLVIYIFRKRLARDFKAFKENFGTYIGYIFKWWGIMLGISAVVGIIRILVSEQFYTANQAGLNSLPLWYVGPLAVIWAPVVEEGIFRGGLRRFIKNDKLFIVLSALLFGLLHTITSEIGISSIIVQSLQYIVMGGIMAYTYTKTNNIFVNMGIHCVQNTFSVVMMILMSLM